MWVPRGAPGQGPPLLPAAPTRRPTCCCLLCWGTACPLPQAQHPGRADTEPSRCPPRPGDCVRDPAFRADTAQPTAPTSSCLTQIRPQGDTVPGYGSMSLQRKTTASESQPIRGCPGRSQDRGRTSVGEHWVRGKTMKSPRSSLLRSQAPQHPSAYASLQRRTRSRRSQPKRTGHAPETGTLSPTKQSLSPRCAEAQTAPGDWRATLATRITTSFILHKIIHRI